MIVHTQAATSYCLGMDTSPHQARAAAAAALRRLGHNFVAHRADDALLDRVAAVADELSTAIAAAPPVVRTFGDELARLAQPVPMDGASLDHGTVCPVSGLENPMGLGMTAYREGDGVRASVTLGAGSAGPPGIAHGGVVAALLDDLMGFVLDSIERTPGYTANLTVTYKRPVPVETPVDVRGRLRRREGRKLFLAASIELDGQTLAEADGLFLAAEVSGPVAAT
jgi:acyl-coenzyme A thioesterase PaaI-like protein